MSSPANALPDGNLPADTFARAQVQVERLLRSYSSVQKLKKSDVPFLDAMQQRLQDGKEPSAEQIRRADDIYFGREPASGASALQLDDRTPTIMEKLEAGKQIEQLRALRLSGWAGQFVESVADQMKRRGVVHLSRKQIDKANEIYARRVRGKAV
jgi:hypothetical protein